MSAVLDYQPERGAFRGEEAAIDGRQCAVGFCGGLGGRPLGFRAFLLICYREPVVSCVKENKGEIDSPGGDPLDAGGEKDPGGLIIRGEGEWTPVWLATGEGRNRSWRLRLSSRLLRSSKSRARVPGDARAQAQCGE